MMRKLLKLYVGRNDEEENVEVEPESRPEPDAPKPEPRLTPKQYFTAIQPYLPYIGTYNTLYIDDTEYITLKIGNETLKIHVNNLNGLYNIHRDDGYYMSCRLCDGAPNMFYGSNGQQDKLHVMSLGHIKNVLTPIDNVHLIRKVDDINLVCGLCNVHISANIFGVENHIFRDTHHTTALLEALDRGKNFKETKDHMKIMIHVPPVSKPSGFKLNQVPNKWLFGQYLKPYSGSLFGAQNTCFGSANAQNIGFGGQPTGFGGGQNSVFGPSSAQNTGFGSASSSGFGSTQNAVFGASNAHNSVFGSTPNSVFGSTQNTGFGTASTANTFGSAQSKPSPFGATQNNTSIFGNTQNNATGFGAVQNNTTGFGAIQNNATGFGVAQNNSSVFNAAQNNATNCDVTQNNATIFGGGPIKAANVGEAQNNATIFGGGPITAANVGAAQNNATGFGASPNKPTGFGVPLTKSTAAGGLFGIRTTATPFSFINELNNTTASNSPQKLNFVSNNESEKDGANINLQSNNFSFKTTSSPNNLFAVKNGDTKNKEDDSKDRILPKTPNNGNNKSPRLKRSPPREINYSSSSSDSEL